MTRDEIIAEAVQARSAARALVFRCERDASEHDYIGHEKALKDALIKSVVREEAAATRALDLAGELPSTPVDSRQPHYNRWTVLLAEVSQEREWMSTSHAQIGAEAYRRLVLEQRAKGASA